MKSLLVSTILKQNSKNYDNDCLNFDCFIILDDCVFVKKYLENVLVQKLAFLLFVREITNKIIRTSKYVLAYICINKTKNNQDIVIRMFVEIHLVNDL